MNKNTIKFGYSAGMIVLLAGWLLGLEMSVQAADYSLILDDQWAEVSSSTPESDLPDMFPAAKRWRSVSLNPVFSLSDKLVPNDTVTLNLFSDAAFTARIDRISTNINGTVTVRGRIDGYPMGYFLISTTEGVSLAGVEIPEKDQCYQIQRNTATDIDYLLEVDINRQDNLEDGPSLISSAPLSLQTDEIQILGGPDDPATIDVMVVYTPAARQYRGGDLGITNYIAESVARGQLALDNSNTQVTLNLVYSGEVNYTETGDTYTDMERLANPSDNYMSTVHPLRQLYGADLVTLLTVTQDWGGLSMGLYDPSGNPDRTFTIVRVQQSLSSYTYIHELGHTMGCGHHKEQNLQHGPGLFDYSAGWRWIGDNDSPYCSIMTYESGIYFSDGRSHLRKLYFSNPDIYYRGVPTGDPVDGDNARTIRETKHIIAAYKTAEPGGALYVLIKPAGAIFAGAQWRVDGGNWHDNRNTQTGLSSGQHTMEFKTIPGWNTPPSQVVDIVDNQITSASGTYTIITYTLDVNSSGLSGVSISSRTGHGGTTDYTQTVTIGSDVSLTAPSMTNGYLFTEWTGDETSDSEMISFSMDAPKTVTANYVRSSSLTVDLHSQDAVDAGAQWRLTPGPDTNWKNSGDTLAELLPGDYTLEFKGVIGFSAPSSKSIHLSGDVYTSDYSYVCIFSSGNGLQGNPFVIDTPDHLIALGNHPALLNMHYVLAHDIDLDLTLAGIPAFTSSVIPSDFTGVFDGKGHKIRNLKIDTNGAAGYNLGLFSRIGSGGEVKNLILRNFSIVGGNSSYYLGGLCGSNLSGNITNVSVSGTITVGDYSYIIGGLCGNSMSAGAITRCCANVGITGGAISGGLGDLCGWNQSSTITDCYATGSVTCGDSSDGLGGLCGYNQQSTLANCYATSLITAGADSSSIGGISGYYDPGITTNSFWNVEATGISDPESGQQDTDGMIGKTTAQMQMLNTYTDAGWDFTQADEDPADWIMMAEFMFPMLAWQADLPGNVAGTYDINLIDFSVFANSWLSRTGDSNFNPDCDLMNTGDSAGVIDMEDLGILIGNWLWQWD